MSRVNYPVQVLPSSMIHYQYYRLTTQSTCRDEDRITYRVWSTLPPPLQPLDDLILDIQSIFGQYGQGVYLSVRVSVLGGGVRGTNVAFSLFPVVKFPGAMFWSRLPSSEVLDPQDKIIRKGYALRAPNALWLSSHWSYKGSSQLVHPSEHRVLVNAIRSNYDSMNASPLLPIYQLSYRLFIPSDL